MLQKAKINLKNIALLYNLDKAVSYLNIYIFETQNSSIKKQNKASETVKGANFLPCRVSPTYIHSTRREHITMVYSDS